MTQAERRRYLIETLLGESVFFSKPEIPADEQGQRDLLRALMNIRRPRPVSASFLQVQDAYLSQRCVERGITDVHALSPVSPEEGLYIWQGDITTLRCDAIVNACNAQMLGCFSPLHNCIDNAIHTYAGVQLRLEMKAIMDRQGHEEPTGQAKITSAYNLPAQYILHTVGPIVQGAVTPEDERLLADCYASCLHLAEENGLESVAFCCLSTGVFRFPKQSAAEIAVATVRAHRRTGSSVKKVIFNVFQNEDLQIYKALLS